MTKKKSTKAALVIYTPLEMQEIIGAMKRAAVAVAEVWDAVRAVEVRTGTEINFALGPILVDDLAPACDTPPSTTDLNDQDVWTSFVQAIED